MNRTGGRIPNLYIHSLSDRRKRSFNELELIDSPPRCTSRDWRAVTVAASARLANRLTIALHRTPFVASTDTKVFPYHRPIVSNPRFWSDVFIAADAGRSGPQQE
jgi:hypothetical protein